MLGNFEIEQHYISYNKRERARWTNGRLTTPPIHPPRTRTVAVDGDTAQARHLRPALLVLHRPLRLVDADRSSLESVEDRRGRRPVGLNDCFVRRGKSANGIGCDVILKYGGYQSHTQGRSTPKTQ